MKFKKISAIAALVICLGAGGYAQDAEQAHIRYQQGEVPETDGELQIAVTEYTHADKTKVTLYGVVHIADRDYYKKVQKDLDTFDSVLYEGVKQGVNANPETKTLNGVQTLMGKVLGLQFQKDGIAYTHSNLVHADISIDELKESIGEDGEQQLNPLGKLFSDENIQKFLPVMGDLIEKLLEQSPEMRNGLKVKLGSQLGQADINKMLSPEMHKAIVLDRNKIVMDVLQKQLKAHPEKKNIAIFYGAAHMPDFNTRLHDLGFKETSKRWMTAWKIGNGSQ